MSNSIYEINKGINRPIEFKGLKAQYIWYLGGGMVLVFLFYVILYTAKVNTFVTLALTAVLGAALFTTVYHLSSTYGEHGLTKALAKGKVPKIIKAKNRLPFVKKQASDLSHLKA
jgi:hypothetical protein